jgi:AraC family transcriptional regulator
LLIEHRVKASTLLDRQASVKRAIDLMWEDLDVPATLAQIAHAARMSEFHFSRVFRQATGLPPLQFQSALRLARARDLVVGTEDAVIEICLKVGYSSIGSFTRRFTELVGMSPMRLRQEVWNNQLPADGTKTGVVVHVRLASREHDLRGPSVVAAYESPCPFGVPVAHTISEGADCLSLGGLRVGSFYLLAFGSNGRATLRASPVLITIEDLAPHPELSLTLRRIEPTDPPILSFIPFMVHWRNQGVKTTLARGE